MSADIDKALTYQVTHDAGVIAVISTRFYPVNLPQTVTLPAAVYQSISGGLLKIHGEVTKLPRPRYQITCWGNTLAEVVQCDLAIKAALDGKRGNWGTGTYVTYVEASQAESAPRDDRDTTTGLYMRFRDYMIMWKET